jgi:hypothetical protein
MQKMNQNKIRLDLINECTESCSKKSFKFIKKELINESKKLSVNGKINSNEFANLFFDSLININFNLLQTLKKSLIFPNKEYPLNYKKFIETFLGTLADLLNEEKINLQ